MSSTTTDLLKLPKWAARLGITVIGVALGAAVTYGHLGATTQMHTAQIAQVTDDISSIREALGRVQLDVALICAEVVRDKGGDPMKQCHTSGIK